MKEVIKLLKENVNGYLATVDDGKPRVSEQPPVK